MEYALTTDSLAKRFGTGPTSVPALQGVNISVQRGEIYGLLGPNGAGKTTFIKCLLGIVFPTGGAGHILGMPLGSIKAKERIGYLPENHRYPLHLSGEQVLSYFGKLSGVGHATLNARIDETLALVGMSEWRTMKVRKYSKGMMQRLGLAQALINDPDLIILDEPTDGVDPVGRKEIRDVLTHLRERGKTVFLNSHLLSEVERISDRVAIMRQGEVITEGSVESLTSKKNQYDIRVEATALDSAKLVLGSVIQSETEGMIHAEFMSTEELNAAIDKLRRQGILIESLVPKRSSLEDLFIELIGTPDLHRAN
ncbi:MAG: ABC transporter ATP-binding protein [Bacteroidota bacterium]|nr:ABC transporter ATP-binding protein [Bacteroidota bacterium]MDP4236973.1 ABC transporter ATP-binding protein [Bacteroidota bacterium]